MSQVEKGITHADIRESIAVAKSHGEKFFEQIVWQVENEVWKILGYGSWDELREAEYADLGVVAPRADRPELVTRLRAKGLTQKEIGATIGASEATVSRQLASASSDTAPAKITNSRGQERPAMYAPRPVPTFDPTPDWDPTTGEVLAGSGENPPKVTDRDSETYTRPEPKEESQPIRPRRRPISDAARDAGWEIRKATEKIEKLLSDDRYPQNREQVTLHLRGHLLYVVESCQGLLDQLD